MNDIKIRTAQLEDVLSLAALSEQLGYETSAEEIEKRLSRLIENQEHVVFVAVSHDENVCGWIHALVSHRLVVDPFAELGGLVVAEDFRRQGIGKLLLNKAEEWAIGKGLNLMRIRARSWRKGAHRFYTKRGYQLLKEQKVFEKPLNIEEAR